MLLGGLNTLVSLASYWLLLLIVHYIVAYLLAFAVGIVFANIVHSKFVFGVPVRAVNTFPLAVWYAVSAALGAGLLVLLVRNGVLSREFAAVAVAAALAPLNYVAVKLILVRAAGDLTRPR